MAGFFRGEDRRWKEWLGARNYLTEFMLVGRLGNEEIGGRRNGQLAEEWRPPRARIFKVNSDAAFWRNTTGIGHRGAGAVARNHEGRIVAATALQLQGVQDSEHTEILEYCLGWNWLEEEGLRELCLNVITLIQ